MEIKGTFPSEYLAAVLGGDMIAASSVVESARNEGISIKSIYQLVFAKVLSELGYLWERGEITVAEEHRATQITQDVMAILRKEITSFPPYTGRVVVCTMAAEDHFLGARWVADFFLMDSWDVHFLGPDMPATELMRYLEKVPVDVVALSLTYKKSLNRVKTFMEKSKSLKNKPLVLLGGMLVETDYQACLKSGADYVLSSVEQGISVARKHVHAKPQVRELQDIQALTGRKIRLLRKLKGMTQQELADSAGVRRSYIASLELGEINYTLQSILKVAVALEVPCETFFKECE